jgi:DNA-binding XRE family transcriptional regulator
MAKSARNSVKNKLGRKVREMRICLKMSQTALAARAETHQEFISGLERGEKNPHVGNDRTDRYSFGRSGRRTICLETIAPSIRAEVRSFLSSYKVEIGAVVFGYEVLS